MLPLPVISSGRRIDDQQVGRHHAVLGMQRGDRAMNRRRLVAADQELRGAREVDVREHELQRARFAAAHRDGCFAVGRRRAGRPRCCPVRGTARARRSGRPSRSGRRAAGRCASARRCAPRFSPAAVGTRFVDVERDVADDVAVGNAEIERLEAHDAGFQHQVRDEIDRSGWCPTSRSLPLNFTSTSCSRSFDEIERLVGQARGSLRALLRFLLLLGCLSRLACGSPGGRPTKPPRSL